VNEFESVLAVAGAFGSFKGPWWISGGWAIDLHLGRVTRAHHDVDALVLRRDQEALHTALGGFELKKIVPHPGGVPRPASSPRVWREGTIVAWERGEHLELPIHQVNAYPADSSEMAFQIKFGESDGAEWWYRRDARVRRRLDAIGYKGQQEIPYLAPEIMLLFKAKTMRSFDQDDFDAVLPVLSSEARRWLRGAIEIAHPNHPWIQRL
jgi:hypothetical protein